jgi:hypothetical protein
MLSTDIAPVFYRSNRGNSLATRTMDIPERERALETKKQPRQMRSPQGAKVLPIEIPSRVVATWRFWTECNSGACSLSRIGTKRDRAASEKTCGGKVLFRHSRFSMVPHWNDCVRQAKYRCSLSDCRGDLTNAIECGLRCKDEHMSIDGALQCISASGRKRASRDAVAKRFENKRRECRNIDT